MKQLTYALMSAAFALILLSSCSKLDWKHWKDNHHKKFLVPDCDAQRIYKDVEGGGIEVQMQKTYFPDGRVKQIGFSTFSAVNTDVYWHSFTLDYNLSERTVTITDSARGVAVLKAIFHPSGRLQRLAVHIQCWSEYSLAKNPLSTQDIPAAPSKDPPLPYS